MVWVVDDLYKNEEVFFKNDKAISLYDLHEIKENFALMLRRYDSTTLI